MPATQTAPPLRPRAAGKTGTLVSHAAGATLAEQLALHLAERIQQRLLAPGLRLGYVVAPRPLYPKLLQAKQAADLHTPGFNQRVVHEIIKDGFLTTHVPTIRALYKTRRDAMQAAIVAHMPAGCRWQTPAGGMFFWLTLPPQLDATALLPQAVAAGMAYVPGAPFFPQGGHANTLRLSFVTATPEQIHTGVAALAQVLSAAL